MPRNRNRQSGPILRTTVTPTAAPTSPGLNPAMRPAPVKGAPGPIRRSRALPLTDTQRDSRGRRSDWNRPANIRPGTTPVVAAWDSTARTMPRGGVWPSDLSSRS